MTIQNYNFPQIASKRWKSPVATITGLPTSGNIAGDVRIAIDTQVLYVWSGSSWTTQSGGGGVIPSSPLYLDAGTLKIYKADTTTNGYLSSADWNTFNAKVPTSISISTTSPLAGGGDLSASRTLTISQSNTTTNGYLSSTDWNTFNNKAPTTNADSTHTGLLTSTDWSTFNNKVSTTRTISTTGPITGGGDLSANRTIAINQSNTTTDGYLSSTDWNTFNGKVSTTRTISTTGPITGGGDLSANRTIAINQSNTSTDGYLSSTDWNTFNGKVATTRTISTTGPLSGGGDLSANRTIAISQANTSTAGYLSSTDWNTFNGKLTPLATTVDNTVPRFDGVAGLLQTSGVTIDDSNNVTGMASFVGTWDVSGAVTAKSVYGSSIDLKTTAGNSAIFRAYANGSSTKYSILGSSGASDAIITGSVAGETCLASFGGNDLIITANPSLIHARCTYGTGTWTLGAAGAASHRMTGVGTDITGSSTFTQLSIEDTNTMAAGVGGGITFRGKYSGSGSIADGAAIKCSKTNATDSNYSFGMDFYTRASGSAPAKVGSVSDAGLWTFGPASYTGRHVFNGYVKDTVIYTNGGNELNSLFGLDADSTVYVNYNGYNGSNTRSRSLTFCDGKHNTVGSYDYTGVWTFPVSVKVGTASGAYTPSALAYYQEGAFTPGIAFNGGTTGITYSTQIGSFTRIGNTVFFRIYVILTSKGSSTGALQVTNLPYTSVATAAGGYPPVTIFANGVSKTNSMLQGYVVSSGTYIIIQGLPINADAGASTTVDQTNVSNSASILISGQYVV